MTFNLHEIFIYMSFILCLHTSAIELHLFFYVFLQLARFKVPKYISIVPEFPLIVTGKVQKYKIRDIATEKLKLKHVAP